MEHTREPSTALAETSGPERPGAEFAQVLHASILGRGLALNRLRDHLAARGQHVGVSTLSYWQNGARRPTTRSLPVIQALEEVLEVAPGTLTTLLPTDMERASRQSRFSSAAGFAGAVDRMVREMGTTGPGHTVNLSVIERLAIGANGAMVSKEVHQVIRAVDEVDRQIVTYQGEPGCDVGLIELNALSGCRLGRQRTDAASGLLLTEMLFDRNLRRHEPHVFQYAVVDRNTIATTEHYRLHIQRGGLHVAEIEFHPERLPVRVEEFYRRNLEEPDVRRRVVDLQDGNRAYLVTEQLVPGISGLSWTWA
ncbi:hypothetical protein PZ938_01895 [Luteipulveratus sp. YIM 133132]|uniref:HTH cro/C1-type domain-containing protein n=1 Tax=Luteipulveratus flavus TaxID=3031728 RepID=A0ABT6CCC3_9MICO|nr:MULTISPECIES: hypothetical protein [unclassified Luteipulveratus]MDE9364346.1 hypothetical protein [Luteipulveratus sp. YIM 133132]MDF8266440.1 hypothetical protein [Luteipulveratus sp. YIM 133296]